MAQFNVTHNNFAVGELSPKMQGRVDSPYYVAGAKEITNMMPTVTGGATRRLGFELCPYELEVAGDLYFRAIPFIFNNDNAYTIYLHTSSQPWPIYASDGTRVAAVDHSFFTTSSTTLDMIQNFRYTQSYNTMIMTYQYIAPTILRRNAHTSWTLETLTLPLAPSEETEGYTVGAALTLSGTTGSIMVTDTSGLFYEADIGRTISEGARMQWSVGNLAANTITSVEGFFPPNLTEVQLSKVGAGDFPAPLSSGISYYYKYTTGPQLFASYANAVAGTPAIDITTTDDASTFYFLEPVLAGQMEISGVSGIGNITLADVITQMSSTSLASNNYMLGGTPDANIKLTVVTYANEFVPRRNRKGKLVNLSSSKAAFRSSDVGKYIVCTTGGTFEIKSVTNSSLIKVKILQRQREGGAKLSGEWTLEDKLWDSYSGFPVACAFHDQRLYFANWARKPQGMVASETGDYFSFGRGDDDADAFNTTITSTQGISHLVSLEALMVLTGGSEVTFEGTDGVISPTGIHARVRSYHGSSRIQPIIVEGSVIFVSPTGRRLYSSTYTPDTGNYVVKDLLKLADHITKSAYITGLTYQPEPDPIIWIALSDGTIASCTYSEEDEVMGWATHSIANLSSSSLIDGTGYIHDIAAVPNGTNYSVFASMYGDTTGTYFGYMDYSGRVGSTTNQTCFTDFSVRIPAGTYTDAAANIAGSLKYYIANLSDSENDILLSLPDDAGAIVYAANTYLCKATEIEYPWVVDQEAIIGLNYESRLELLTPEVNVGTGTSQISHMHSNLIGFRVYDSMDFKFNGDYVSRDVTNINWSSNYNTAVTTDLRIENYNWGVGEHTVLLTQDRPVPLTISAIFMRMTVNQ